MGRFFQVLEAGPAESQRPAPVKVNLRPRVVEARRIFGAFDHGFTTKKWCFWMVRYVTLW